MPPPDPQPTRTDGRGPDTGSAAPPPPADTAAGPDGPVREVLPPGSSAGRYVLGDEIARGGMGAVFAARDGVLGRDVAVKVLGDRYPAGGPAARRFVAEARITGQLQHPGIPPVHDLGALPDGRPFLAMKLIRGQTLDQLLKARPDPAADRGRLVAVFEQVCQAVGYAHAHGVVHRDLKPANVMVGSFGEVQVMDWGLAKVLTVSREAEPSADPEATAPATAITAPREADEATRAGSVLGTPAYMPPEQAIGAVDGIDRRSDVFGLGAILCAVLTGQPPFVGADAESTRQLAARGRVADAFGRLDASGAEPDLIALCKRCLAAEKADRPADAGAVAAEVAALRQAAEARARRAERDKLSAEVRAAEQSKRRRAVQRSGGAVAAVLLLGVAGTTAGLVRADAARRDADAKRIEAENAMRVKALHVKLTESLWAAHSSLSDLLINHWEVPERPGRVGVAAELATAAAAKVVEQSEEALAANRRELGPDHPVTLRNTHILAVSYHIAGRRADALRLGEEALAAYRREFGPDHPDALACVWSVAESLVALNRGAEAVPLIDECVARAAGKPVEPGVVSNVIALRMRHFRKAADPAGCRATAAMWEGLNRPDATSLYNAACWRAVAAGVYAKAGQPAEAAADADRAMGWLAKAVAAGYLDRAHMKTDEDLDFLRGRADFWALVTSLTEAAPPPRPARR